MGDLHLIAWQGGGIEGEPVVLAGDLHQPPTATGMVQTPVAKGQLVGAAAEGQAKNLMAKADPERGQIGLRQQALRQLDAGRHGGWITRTIGEEDPFRGQGQHLLDAAVSRQHAHLTTMGGEALKDAPLDAEIDRHDPVGIAGTACWR